MLFGNRMLSEDVINIQNVKIDSKSCKNFWVCMLMVYLIGMFILNM